MSPDVHSILCKKENAHEEPIYSCAWSRIKPTGDTKETTKDFVVTGGLDGIVKVWHDHSNQLKLVHELQGHCMAVISIAISPDGHTIATTSLDSTMIIWELTSGNNVHEIHSEDTDMWQVSFSPDGTHIVTGSHNGRLTIYNIETKQPKRTFDTRGLSVLCVAWSNDDKHIACGSVDGNVCIFKVSQGKLLHTVEAHMETVRSVCFSPNSQLLVTASNDGFVKLFDVASANELCKMDLTTWVLSARFTPDGGRIAAAAANGSVTIILLESFKALYTFKEHTGIVWDAHFNAGGNKLVSVSKDKAIIVYKSPRPQKPAK
ncbi:unnamed protein product [Leptidea sinapis]|uniref:Uncharacterized protein n=1 Tax=Leptidea sinapis TaxID=189913 RepID=A0A5E4R194_9NEOP|nr:unnamed protein product [Leptidea sinapis]